MGHIGIIGFLSVGDTHTNTFISFVYNNIMLCCIIVHGSYRDYRLFVFWGVLKQTVVQEKASSKLSA